MSNSKPALSIYESAFAPSDKTDGILVVGAKKLHINKMFLSIHSKYFDDLFKTACKEKTQPEFEIKGVKFEEFAQLLNLVHPNAIAPDGSKALELLELAVHFQLPVAKNYLEVFIAQSTFLDKEDKLMVADGLNLDILMEHTLLQYGHVTDFKNMHELSKNFSEKSKARIFDDFFMFFGKDLK